MKNRYALTLTAFILTLLFIAPVCVSAKDEWIKIRSKNFTLVGNAAEKDVRKVATRLEQFRETFRQVFNLTNLDSSIPTNVVVFKSASAYKPFLPKRADGKADTGIAGYFQPGEDANYITLSTEGEDADTYGTIFHEYVHFIVNTNFGKSDVPPWFNEGLAEYYQTFAIEEDQKVKLGLPQYEHLQLLAQNKLIPLETLFKVSNYALHQNGNHSRSIFYAEAWALIHYLVQSGKSAGLSKFLTLALKSEPTEKTFQDAFQMTYAQMESELRKYVAKNSYQYSLVTFKSKLTFDAEMQVAPMLEAESNAYLGDLLYHSNRADEAEAYLQKAVALAPDSSMANTSLGMVKIEQKKYDEAKKYLDTALAQDNKNHLAFYRYAYLLSREDRDEFGFVAALPAEKAAKMRELLKKAIAAKPSFTESYELFAFVSLVNNELLDEAISYLRTALRYQPGNQRYALRIAEIQLRQNKFAEAVATAEKIAKTADEPEIKAEAERLAAQLRQGMDIMARNEAASKQYETSGGETESAGGQPVLVRRERSAASEKIISPEERAKAEENERMISINEAIKKAENGEQRVVGQIQKIECKGKIIVYTIKTDTETFALSSPDFQNLTLTSYVDGAENKQIGCGANIAEYTTVLTYKPLPGAAKTVVRGELSAVYFVPKNFHFINVSEARQAADNISAADNSAGNYPAPPSAVAVSGDIEEARRKMMLQSIKQAMRQPQPDEKRLLEVIEKVECGAKGTFFYFKTATSTVKLAAPLPQAMQIRAFTPEVEQTKFGCGMKPLDVPVVFTYKEVSDAKTKAGGI